MLPRCSGPARKGLTVRKLEGKGHVLPPPPLACCMEEGDQEARQKGWHTGAPSGVRVPTEPLLPAELLFFSAGPDARLRLLHLRIRGWEERGLEQWLWPGVRPALEIAHRRRGRSLDYWGWEGPLSKGEASVGSAQMPSHGQGSGKSRGSQGDTVLSPWCCSLPTCPGSG